MDTLGGERTAAGLLLYRSKHSRHHSFAAVEDFNCVARCIQASENVGGDTVTAERSKIIGVARKYDQFCK